MQLVHGDRGDCFPGVQVLGWDEELAEMTTNEVLNNLEVQEQESIDPSEAIDLAVSLLPDVEAYITLQELQCVRAEYPLPADNCETQQKSELSYIQDEGPFQGWVRAAYAEQQWLFNENSYSKEAEEKIEIQLALAIEPDDFPAPEDVPPLFQADYVSWVNSPVEGLSLPLGLCFGLADYNTFLGEIRLLVPHPNLISTLKLTPSSLFTLKDKTDEDVLVFRHWQKIHETSYDTEVVELQGSEILMHPKLLKKIKKMSEHKVISLKSTTRSSVTNPAKR